ncbi:hypothetical protein, partial [Acinetobacter guillouiae]|uniref:hypothetical protein n=1 Tax=Acinetobacter guillouiae TaxID=106649 RepID=UPI00125FD784
MNYLYSLYKLDYKNPECDFLNINLDQDTRLFVDAYAMYRSSNQHMQLGHETLRIFMSETLSGLKNYLKDPTAINSLWQPRCFAEPKGTGIGLAKNGHKGRGSNEIKCQQIITALRHSKAVETGDLEDLEELLLVIEGIGSDTISDITINIAKKHFIEYTQEKCRKLNIPISTTKEKIRYFCNIDRKWKSDKFELPHLEIGLEKSLSYLIFIPNEVLEKNMAYGCNYCYTNIATPIFVNQVLEAGLSFIYSLKAGSKRVNKKDMRKNDEYKGGKKRMDNFISNHPDSLKKYTKIVAHNRTLRNQ